MHDRFCIVYFFFQTPQNCTADHVPLVPSLPDLPPLDTIDNVPHVLTEIESASRSQHLDVLCGAASTHRFRSVSFLNSVYFRVIVIVNAFPFFRSFVFGTEIFHGVCLVPYCHLSSLGPSWSLSCSPIRCDTIRYDATRRDATRCLTHRRTWDRS